MTRTEPVPSSRNATLALAALGVVYGDIGTSPLYTMKEIFAGSHHPVPITHDNVLGILSLIFWALTIIVSVKYVIFIMRADNKGEGGIMALMALVMRGEKGRPCGMRLMLLGLFGAALFYGDGVITPAISVLSAVEGLEIATPAFKPYVIPIALGVLIALFLLQRRGTAMVGGLFGPVTMVWFAVLALLGAVNIALAPQVLAALNPAYAFAFFHNHWLLSFLALGAVVLAVTGTEALYADMGHFGRRPIQLAWFGLVMPALVLNYFGQGALLLTRPEAIENPFYLMAPRWALYPMVALATTATIIASQAVISGAYSLTLQAMQLGYAPRMEVQHTSSRERGQIYIPALNWTLLLAVIALVMGFGSSTNLAAAYGVAVTGTMIITTVLAFVVVRDLWGWGPWKSVPVLGAFLLIDAAFFSANLVKIEDGGWFPLAFGAGMFLFMTTWKRGRDLLHARLETDALPLADFVAGVSQGDVARIPGTAVFLTATPAVVPHALLHSLKHYRCLHERVVILTVVTRDEPYVPDSERIAIEPVNAQFCRLRVSFGFMDEPDIPKALELASAQGLEFDPMQTSFFLGRETLIPKLHSEMAYWRERLFVAMYRNSGSAVAYFRLPSNRVVELGTQIVL